MQNLAREGANLVIPDEEVEAEMKRLGSWMESIATGDPENVDRIMSTIMFMLAKTVCQRRKLTNLLIESNGVLQEHHMDRVNQFPVDQYQNTNLCRRTATALQGAALPDEVAPERKLIIT